MATDTGDVTADKTGGVDTTQIEPSNQELTPTQQELLDVGRTRGIPSCITSPPRLDEATRTYVSDQSRLTGTAYSQMSENHYRRTQRHHEDTMKHLRLTGRISERAKASIERAERAAIEANERAEQAMIATRDTYIDVIANAKQEAVEAQDQVTALQEVAEHLGEEAIELKSNAFKTKLTHVEPEFKDILREYAKELYTEAEEAGYARATRELEAWKKNFMDDLQAWKKKATDDLQAKYTTWSCSKQNMDQFVRNAKADINAKQREPERLSLTKAFESMMNERGDNAFKQAIADKEMTARLYKRFDDLNDKLDVLTGPSPPGQEPEYLAKTVTEFRQEHEHALSARTRLANFEIAMEEQLQCLDSRDMRANTRFDWLAERVAELFHAMNGELPEPPC